MANTEHLNNSGNLVDIHNSSAQLDTRELFFEWLSSGNYKKYTIVARVNSFDQASGFAIEKKICSYSLWMITQPSIFKSIYQRLLDAKLFRISNKAIYKVFIETGKLYQKFLKEKPWRYSKPEPDSSTMAQVSATPASVIVNESQYVGFRIDGEQPQREHGSSLSVKLTDNERESLNVVLSKKFSNGFAHSSPIQIGRLKRFVTELLGYESSLTDDEIITYVTQCGTEFDGKIFVVSEETKQKIKTIADEYFERGGKVIFYEAFFDKHEQFLMEASVISEDMLKNIFRRLYRQTYYYEDTYFGKTFGNINEVITNEILRVWGHETLLSYEQLSYRLVYIPLFRLKSALVQDGRFIRNSTGVFTNVDHINISEDECKAINQAAEIECNNNRFVSITELPIAIIGDNNSELSLNAVQDGVFRICLSDKFNMKGKIISRKSDSLMPFDIIKEHCRAIDTISLVELLTFGKELTSSKNYILQAAYDTMARIDEYTYVSDKYVEFDIHAIDGAIEHFMNGGEYIPLQAVTTFAMFPNCGHEWNLFVLESYCRRFSTNFRFDTRSVNSKNIGAIVRRHSRLTYEDIIIDCVAHSDTPLNGQAVLNYLLDNGLVSQRWHSNIDGLIRKIRMIRERGN